MCGVFVDLVVYIVLMDGLFKGGECREGEKMFEMFLGDN